MQSCCWSWCSRHEGRQSQHSDCWNRWLSKRPEVGQRPQLDTPPNKLCNRVNGQRHSLILWHRSNVQGGLFTQWDSGTWVVKDLAGICLDEDFETHLNLDLDEERRLSKICTFGMVTRTILCQLKRQGCRHSDWQLALQGVWRNYGRQHGLKHYFINASHLRNKTVTFPLSDCFNHALIFFSIYKNFTQC